MLLQEGAGVAAGAGGGGKQAQHSVAQAVAVLCTSAGGKRVAETVERLLTMAKARDVGEWGPVISSRKKGVKGVMVQVVVACLGLGES